MHARHTSTSATIGESQVGANADIPNPATGRAPPTGQTHHPPSPFPFPRALLGVGLGLFGHEILRPRLGVRRLFALRRRLQHLVDDQPCVLAHGLLDLGADLGMLLQERLGVLAPLADALAAEGEPGARLLDDAGLDAQIDQLAGLGDALAVHDVELDLLEGRRHLVLDDLDAGLVADHLLALLDLADAADVEAHGGVELQRIAAGRRLGVAEHDADLHADLVDEDHHALGLGDRGRQLAQRLAHQARLHAGLHVAHLAFELGLGRERRHRVDHQHVDGAGAHQRVGDLERLLAVVGLRDQQILDLDAELAGVDRVERVLGIDEGADAALLLGLRHHLQGKRGLAGGLRPVDLDHAPARQAADAQRDVEPERARRDGLHLDALVVGAEPHDRALAEVLVDLIERGLERLLLVHASPFDHAERRLFHRESLIS